MLWPSRSAHEMVGNACAHDSIWEGVSLVPAEARVSASCAPNLVEQVATSPHSSCTYAGAQLWARAQKALAPSLAACAAVTELPPEPLEQAMRTADSTRAERT